MESAPCLPAFFFWLGDVGGVGGEGISCSFFWGGGRDLNPNKKDADASNSSSPWPGIWISQRVPSHVPFEAKVDRWIVSMGRPPDWPTLFQEI